MGFWDQIPRDEKLLSDPRDTFLTLWDPSQENDGNHSFGGNFLVLIQEMMLYATVYPRYNAPGNDALGLIPEKMGLSA